MESTHSDQEDKQQVLYICTEKNSTGFIAFLVISTISAAVYFLVTGL